MHPVKGCSNAAEVSPHAMLRVRGGSGEETKRSDAKQQSEGLVPGR
jgi:hypothetical protein